MADAQVLRDLAQEVEGLAGPSRAINLRIWRACAPHDAERAYWKQRPLIARGTPDEEASAVAWRRVAPPDCTGSIDAAMTMKPPRWRLASLQEEPPEIGGWRATGHRASPGVAIEGAAAKTASLTVTALWLRALAADLEGTDAGTD